MFILPYICSKHIVNNTNQTTTSTMAIEDTFPYRFIRVSLVMSNCMVLIPLILFLLQCLHIFNPTFVFLILLIGSNFMFSILGAIREHRASIVFTGSVTLILFLFILVGKGSKTVTIKPFLILLAISVQSLIFSEMLKQRQLIYSQRQSVYPLMNRNVTMTNPSNGHLAAVVVYQAPGMARTVQSNGVFTFDPILSSDLPNDPPPSYFATNCPPPKYEDAINLSACDQSLPIVSAITSSETSTTNVINQPSSNTQNSESPNEPNVPSSESTTSPSLNNARADSAPNRENV